MSTDDDATRLGRQLRALRRRKRMRQSDVADKAGVAQTTISLVERGHAETLSIATIAAVAGVMDARVKLSLSWRGGDLDRLTDERHAAVAAQVAVILRSNGWDAHVEVTFAIAGEHGSIDLLAWHASTRTLLVVEIKTFIASGEEMLRTLDKKVRLAPLVARRFGWRANAVGRLVVLPATRTNRRHARQISTLAGPSLMVDAWATRRWIRTPAGSHEALWVLSTIDAGGGDRDQGGFVRVRRSRGVPPAPVAKLGETDGMEE